MRVASLVVGLVLLAGCGKKGEDGKPGEDRKGPAPGPGPIAGGIPEDWTHAELSTHLAKRGANYKMINTHPGPGYGPAVYFVTAGSPLATDHDEAKKAFHRKSPDVIYCELKASPQSARDDAGSYGDISFAAGRFVFLGTHDALAAIRRHLP